MSDVVLVSNFDAQPRVWHFVREQWRLDLAVSFCGIDNGESWLVGGLGLDEGTVCTPCMYGVLQSRGVAI